MDPVFLCGCGRESIHARGRCARCYAVLHRSEQRFAGQYELVLARDGGRCTNCASERVIVHHRSRLKFITLCVCCHPKVHRTKRPGFGMTDLLLLLWREQHKGWPEQRRLNFDAATLVLQPELWELAA